MTQISKINGIPVVDTFVTGGTYVTSASTITLSRNDTGNISITGITSGGEVNTASNIGGANNIFAQKTGVDLEFRTLVAGANIQIVSGATSLTISGSTGGGSFTNFIMSDGTTTQTIDDGDTMLFSTNSGLTATVSATDTVTFDFNITGMTAEATPASGDKLLLWDNVSKTHKNIDWDDLPGAGGGEVNTASNVGAGDNVFKQKTGVDLEFRTLVAGTNVTITSGATDLTINASGGGGTSRTTGSTQTTNATASTGGTINLIVDDATNVIEVFVKAYESAAAEYGSWKRTLTVTKVSGTVVIREINADVDKTSTGLNANSVDFIINGGNISIQVTGIAATTIDWATAWEVII